jgi:hypothetical protein
MKAVTPYAEQPDHAFWRKAISSLPASRVNPVVDFKSKINRTDKIVTAGSCFAQHIARRLQARHFCHLVTEPAPCALTPRVAKAYNYGVFSARYGNIYTSRQLVQLFDRAYGDFQPAEDVWVGEAGEFVDPFRPAIQSAGFATRVEYDADRKKHLAAVRRAFEELDVFVFTLGLTECWTSRLDGAAFPLCPGVVGGHFDGSRHRLVNLTVTDVVQDMCAFFDRLKRVNTGARAILTVSPVPLVATATDHHVLVANTYSKSVLRVAAEEIAAKVPAVQYFPSFEIITGSFNEGAYYESDRREVASTGVDHVMRLFFAHATVDDRGVSESPGDTLPSTQDAVQRRLEEALDIVCDEVALDRTAG